MFRFRSISVINKFILSMKIQIQCERYRTGFRVFPFLVYTSSLTGSHSLKLEGEFNVLIYKLASFIVFYNQFFSEERRSNSTDI